MTLSGPHKHPTQTHTAQPSTVLNAAHPDREKPAMTQAQDLLQFNSQSQLLGKKPSQNICEHHFLKTAWECLSKYNTQQIQIKLRWALFVTYTIIQSIMRSEMCSLHLTHPSGAVGSRLCGVRGAVGGSLPCSRVSPQSWTLPAGAGIQTHNLGLPQVQRSIH